MKRIRKHAGRRRAITLFWALILSLLAFALCEKLSPTSDFSVATVLGAKLVTFAGLAIYICRAKRTYESGNLRFTFSKEHGGVVEMHLKRTSCCRTACLRTSLIAALREMHSYAQDIGSSRLEIETPLLDSKAASLIAKRAAKVLGVSYQLHQPKKLNRVVSTLAHRAIHKCDVRKPKLRESISANLVAHGFTLQLPA